MAIMTHAKFHFNWLMLTSIFGIWASEPPHPWAWRTTEKAGPDRVKHFFCYKLVGYIYLTLVTIFAEDVRIDD